MRLPSKCSVIASFAIAQTVAIGPALANVDNIVGSVTAQPSQGMIHPLTIVAVYGLSDPSVLCASAGSIVASQDPVPGQTPDPQQSATQEDAPVPQVKEGCVLPVIDQTATPATPPAESEIAPLGLLGPLLAAAAAGGTAAAVASSNEGGESPVSPS